MLRQLGHSHSGLVNSLFFKILGIDKRFQAIDPSWSDIVHVGKMILIYAASNEQPDILNNAPAFVHKSLDYLKDEYSQYFIQKIPEQAKLKSIENQDMEEPLYEASTEEDLSIRDKINNFFSMGLIT